MSSVIAALACPSIFWTAFTFAPAETARLAAVILSGSEIFGALFDAGLPTEGWRHGEANAVKRWLLDQRDRLTEYVDEPQ